MQATAMVTELRKLGYVAVLAVGLALGAAMPAVADSSGRDVAALCEALGFTASETEWVAPPTPGRPGEAF